MAQRVAVVTGTALSPGASKNRRRYSAETNIPGAYKRLSARLADPNGRPVVMRTHHPVVPGTPPQASDMSVTNIAGRVTGVSLTEDGHLRWEADLADSAAGRDVASLVTPDQPYLRNVSIRGWWVGPVRTDPDGCETADDLEIDGLDFTHSPGVDGAVIDTAALAESGGVPAGAVPVIESVEDAIVTDTAPAVPAPAPGVFADPGYQGDKRKRLPISSRNEALATWGQIHEAAVQRPYTGAQVKRITQRTRAALRTFGVDPANHESIAETLHELVDEAWANVDLDNNDVSMRVAGYVSDPANLAAAVRKMALAAIGGLLILDPDNDGDLDLGATGAGEGAETCPTCSADVDPDDNYCPACGAQLSVAGESHHHQEAPVATAETKPAPAPGATTRPTPPKPFETMTAEELNAYAASLNETKPAAPAAGAVTETDPAAIAAATAAAVTPPAPAGETAPALATLSEAQRADAAAKVAALLTTPGALEALGALRPATGAPAAPVRPTPPKPFEQMTAEELVAYAGTLAEAKPAGEKTVAEQIAEARDEIRAEVLAKYGTPGRRGLVPTSETAEPTKPLHEMSTEEFESFRDSTLGGLIPR